MLVKWYRKRIARRLSDFQVEANCTQIGWFPSDFERWIICRLRNVCRRIVWRLSDFQVISRGESYMLVKWFSQMNCTQIEWFPSDQEVNCICWSSDFRTRIVHRLSDFQVTSRGESYAGQVIFVHELYTDWVISKWLREVNRMLVKWFSNTNCTQIEWFPSDFERWIVCWSSDIVNELHADWVISKSRRIVRRLGDFQVTLRGESYAD